MGFQFSKKFACRIYPRCGLSLKSLFLGSGVVDSGYRGNISVILTNFDWSNVEIKKRDGISQIIFLIKEEADSFDDTTVRGLKGFGSTD